MVEDLTLSKIQLQHGSCPQFKYRFIPDNPEAELLFCHHLFFCQMLIVLFRRGVYTYCGGPNRVYSYPEDSEEHRVQSKLNVFMEGRNYVSLVPFYVSSYLWRRIKIIFTRI